MSFALFLIFFTASIMMVYTFFSIVSYVRSSKRVALPENAPFVSILKPVKKPDKHFKENIESFFRLDYSQYELLFALEDESDGSLIIHEMMVKYPGVSCRIVYTGREKIGNPKVDNLVALEKIARGDYFWIADANVRVKSHVLSRLVKEASTEGSALIFCPIRGAGAESMGSFIENSHTNLFVSGNILSAWYLAHRQITVGKSMFMERKALEINFGGFSFFRDYLAEDYMIGCFYEQYGLPVSTNGTWITHYNSSATVDSFYSRMRRWALMRYRIDPKWYLAEIFANPLFVAVVATVISADQWHYCAMLIALKLFCEAFLFLLVERGEISLKDAILYPLYMLLKDVILMLVYVTPFFVRSVNWRGRKIRVGKRSMIMSTKGSSING